MVHLPRRRTACRGTTTKPPPPRRGRNAGRSAGPQVPARTERRPDLAGAAVRAGRRGHATSTAMRSRGDSAADEAADGPVQAGRALSGAAQHERRRPAVEPRRAVLLRSARAATTASRRSGARCSPPGARPGSAPAPSSTPSSSLHVRRTGDAVMTAATPRTVEQYLDLLRAELQGADPALVQDALYDAEEHLRAELAQHPDAAEETMLGRIVASYGAPGEVADAYRIERNPRAGRAAHAAAEAEAHGARPLLRRLLRSARLPEPGLHAAGARDRHLLLHVRGDGPVAVGRPRDPDHRHPVLPAVHRHHARARAGRRPHRRVAARHAHAAPARASRARPRAGCSACSTC